MKIEEVQLGLCYDETAIRYLFVVPKIVDSGTYFYICELTNPNIQPWVCIFRYKDLGEVEVFAASPDGIIYRTILTEHKPHVINANDKAVKLSIPETNPVIIDIIKSAVADIGEE